VPIDYFPDDDPNRRPRNRWKSSAHLLYGNWINEVYQTTSFELDQIGRTR
jgi:homoserine O-succinyltransferase